MNNLETLATLSTQNTGRRQPKQSKITTQQRKLKRSATRSPQKTAVNTGAREG